MNIKQKLKKSWQGIALALLAIGFFVAASSFNYLTQNQDFVKWLAPDENANYTFTKLYAQTGSLTLAEKYNVYADDIIHPRSFRADQGLLKPMSFLGIILIYGKIAAFTSIEIIPYLTPIFGAIGIIFFYLLIKELFDKRVGLLSAFLLAVFPPYFYYSSRSMFHNILFIVLLLIGLYFSIIMNRRKLADNRLETPLEHLSYKFLYPALAGAFFGLAIITRTSELLWLGPLLFLLWILNCKRTGIIKLGVLLSFLFLSLLPVLYWNQVIYGSPISTGYPEMNTSMANLAQNSTEMIQTTFAKTQQNRFAVEKELFNKIKNTIFYFGLDYYMSFKMFYYYFFRMFAWLFWLALSGFILFLTKPKKITKGQIVFLSGYVVISTILLFYYGSWEFHDNPDIRQTTIGNSYTRYWLPIYLGALPFASLLIVRLSRYFKNKVFINAIRVAAVALIFFSSVQLALSSSDEGLIISASKQNQSKYEFDQVLKLTEKNSVIISRYHDKLFFPERKVILGLFDDDNMNREYAKLANYLPVYYYNFTFPEKDFKYLNRTKLAKVGLQIKKIRTVTTDLTLYKLERVK